MQRNTTQPMVSIFKTACLVVIALLSIVLNSCTVQPVQLYEGVHPSNEISTISSFDAAQIKEVDGVKTAYNTIKILPGTHTVTAEVRGFRYKNRFLGPIYGTTGRTTLNWDAKAGKTYLVNGRHGGPTGWRIWITEAIPRTTSMTLPTPTTVVAGNAPPAHVTGDKSISLPFVTPVNVYAKKVVLYRGASICTYPLCRENGTLTINDGSVAIEGDDAQETLKISKGNIQNVKLGEFLSPAEVEPPNLIEAIFLYYVESGENKVIVLTSTPSDTEQDSYIYSALLHITKTIVP